MCLVETNEEWWVQALWDSMIFWKNLGVGAGGPVRLANIHDKLYAVKMVCKFKSPKSAIEQLKNESLVFEYLENEKGRNCLDFI